MSYNLEGRVLLTRESKYRQTKQGYEKNQHDTYTSYSVRPWGFWPQEVWQFLVLSPSCIADQAQAFKPERSNQYRNLSLVIQYTFHYKL